MISQVAAYLRVSTLDQEKGIQSQEHALEQYLQGHGIEAVWYRDRLSGGTIKRPSFDRLQRDIFNGKVRTVVCWKLDRLSRSLRDGINVLCDWLDKDVRVIAVAQQIDFNGAMGRMLGSVLFALAEMERDNIREATKRGLAHARARGVRLGRPEGEWVDRIDGLLSEGHTIASAARVLGRSRNGLVKALARRSGQKS